ncbi:MAG: orotidine-5'-phosphate decarboxylase [Dehalococcoidia bacterium]|nr:orotidine-5'-phosphate decarboxylase [Dehalococcoidia bacterium]
MGFKRKLRDAVARYNSLLCVGLDPDPRLMPAGLSIAQFNKEIIDATKDLVCAYKPNLAFYEAEGIKGLRALEETLAFIPSDIPVIGDAKRGDIGNTAKKYAYALFESFEFDAATVNPYLGLDAVIPFSDYSDKGIFLLCRTSNPSAGDFQDLIVDGHPLYEHVAMKAIEWNLHRNIGLVVGATYPDELAQLRELCPTMPFLVPGIGTQGGDLSEVVLRGTGKSGAPAIINSSRAILYASSGSDFAESARLSATLFRDEINSHRPPFTSPGVER